MSTIKPYLLFFTLFCAAETFAQFTDVINSNRPGESMAAFSVGQTVIQGELGFNTFRERYAERFYDVEGIASDVQIRYGAFFEQLEFILDADYQNEVSKNTSTFESERNAGLKNIRLGAKFLVYDPTKNYQKKPNLYSYNANHKFSWRQFIPAVGLYAGGDFSFSKGKFDRPGYFAENKFSPTLGLLTQNQLGRVVLCINVMADKVATQRESINYVVSLTRGISPRWSVLLEHQGFVNDFRPDQIFRLGGAWLAAGNVQVDASIGASIKETPSYVVGGIGLSWRFDANYEEIYLRIPKDDKKDSKEDKKKKKEKKDAKKRVDEIENTDLPK